MPESLPFVTVPDAVLLVGLLFAVGYVLVVLVVAGSADAAIALGP